MIPRRVWWALSIWWEMWMAAMQSSLMTLSTLPVGSMGPWGMSCGSIGCPRCIAPAYCYCDHDKAQGFSRTRIPFCRHPVCCGQRAQKLWCTSGVCFRDSWPVQRTGCPAHHRQRPGGGALRHAQLLKHAQPLRHAQPRQPCPAPNGAS